jgi:c-di-GMP-binding flagellar brake protein YcgR
MLAESVKVGDRMEIHHRSGRRTAKAYVSQVQDILGPNQLIAYAPMEYGAIIKLPNGDECISILFTEKGILKFDSVVVRNVVKDDIFYVVLRLSGDGERIQRRDFFRFDCLLDFTFGVVEVESEVNGHVNIDNINMENMEMEHIDPGITVGGISNTEKRNIVAANCKYSGILKDLGGGGIRFVSNDDIEERVDICCVINLEGEVILPVGRVLHKQYFPKSNYIYQYRVQFYVLPQYEQEKIIQYIFNEQRKIIRKTR